MRTMRLDGPERRPVTGGNATSLVVLLHGLGADGEDLIGLAEPLGSSLPDARFVSPNAPFPCDMAPYGRQWFSLQDRSMAMLAAGARAAADVLGAYLAERLEAEGLTPRRLALLGFSQGAMMALQVGLRMDPGPAAILAYSGMLVDADSLGEALAGRPAESLPRVLLVHGEEDGVVPAAASRAAASQLKALGVPVQALFRPALGHGIDPAGIEAGAQFLASLG